MTRPCPDEDGRMLERAVCLMLLAVALVALRGCLA